MNSLRHFPYTSVSDITFRIYSEEEIEKISVVEVSNENSINALGHMLENGIYDLRMGPVFTGDSCMTCNCLFKKCRGHFGHINLPVPVCNPFFYDIIRDLISRICPSCFRFQAKAKRGLQFVYECILLSAGYDIQSLGVANVVSRFLAEPDEAIEDYPCWLPKQSKKKKSEDSVALLMSLEKKLKKYVKNIKKSEEASQLSTCNSEAVRDKLFRKFNFDSKCKMNDDCMHCYAKLISLKFQNSKMVIRNFEARSSGNKQQEATNCNLVMDSQPYLTPKQAKEMLQECYKRESLILKHLHPILAKSDLTHPTDMFFIDKLLVTPPKYRPLKRVNQKFVETDMGLNYKNIVKLSKCLQFMVQHKSKTLGELPEALEYLMKEFRGETLIEKSHTIWQELQNVVERIYDSEYTKNKNVTSRGLRQIVEKKAGLFRQNLMGKRVDYSARSVAAPDPMLATDEVGVPKIFAMKLTYPVPVTHWNVPKLKKLVQNGPLTYPGALMVEDEEGRKTTLKADDFKHRDAIARSLLTPIESGVKKRNATKIVYRHLQNGDYVLMNRQPTLHRPSIQAHKVRLMDDDKVLRLPYASCKAYNADFDGDELNMHFPQSEMARSEAKYIVTAQNQYLTPKDGSPLSGLIQDCVVASVMLTTRGKFFSMEDYQQLVYVSVSETPREILFLPPAILKPQKLWSGKQIISTILLNLIPRKKAKPTFKFKTAVKVDLWQNQEEREWKAGGTPEKKRESMTESEFILRNGELVCGVVDKCAIGSTSYGLVHTCYELYGGSVATQLLTSINRLCVTYLQWVGHTISLKEFVTPNKAAKRRRKALRNLIESTEDEVSKKLNLKPEKLSRYIEFLHKSENQKEMSVLDAAYTSVLGPVTSTITSENEENLYRNNLQNKMRMMVDTGAKGSKVNMNQMASLFGSVAIDGQRMPMSVTGKTLPAFKPYETNPRAGGYIPSRFVTGMDPKSYFFLCIVGRDSLQHTAVKTSNSGYMQRCLIKHLEGIHVEYDMTVRNSDGLVLQFEYGEDSLDVSKVPFLRDVATVDALMGSYTGCLDKKDVAIALSFKSPQTDKHKKLVKKYKHKCEKEKRAGAFLNFVREQKKETLARSQTGQMIGRSSETLQLLRRWNRLTPEKKELYQVAADKLKLGRDTTSSTLFGASQFGVVSEAMDALIEDYYNSVYSQRRPEEQPLSKDEVTTALYMKALNSRVDPGEAVGALCAQAIGEPLTQMTLNTFHFAGRDELNVTLGVPRMVEILRTASENIKTPIMEVPFKPHVRASTAEKLKIILTPVSLDKVLYKVRVTSDLQREGTLYRRTEVHFEFLPHKEYKKVYSVTPSSILTFMEKKFIHFHILGKIRTALKKTYTAVGMFSKKPDAEDDEVEVEGEGQVSETINQLFDEENSEESEEEEEKQAANDADMSTAARTEKKKEVDYSDGEDGDGDGDEIEKEVDEMDPDGGARPLNGEEEEKNAIDDIFPSEDEGLGEEEEEEDNRVDDPEEVLAPNEEEGTPVVVKKDVKKQKAKGKKANPTEYDVLLRRTQLKARDSWVIDYEFDEKNFLWCKVFLKLPIAEGRYDLASIVEKEAATSLVHCVPNVKKAFVVQKEDHLLLRTEGVNISKICLYEHILDINRLYTNNIHFMSKRYGIEAAQRSVIKEIREVQSAYDIKVDFRHLSLLADYFTCEGVYKACSRHAINTCSSPIQKMSYETFFHFLRTSLVHGLPDNMSSPSANVMVGQPIKIGTNSMDVLSKFSTLPSC